MGKATRWLKNLLSGKKEIKEYPKDGGLGGDRGERKRWSFKSGRESTAEVPEGSTNPTIAATQVDDNVAWLRSMYLESEKEQNKHAIAVAAATAAAADAAVAAAQAAVAVVRLTSQGRATLFGGIQERRIAAAVKIQTFFRAYLAKKALRALKALVKLQALVRGYLVRKQAAATLQSMQALVRAQATIRAQRSRVLPSSDRRFLPELRPRRSLEKFDDARSERLSSIHSRRLSGNLDNMNNGYDRSPKIVEIDTCRPKSRSSRSRTSPSLVDSTEDTTLNSISIPDCRNFQDYDVWPTNDRYRHSSTAQSTPRYMNFAGINAPPTPAKSECAMDGVFHRFLNLPNCPSYMSNTRSFEAKVRSQSAPKQRQEQNGYVQKRLPLSEVLVDSRASLSGVGMQRSCARAREVAAAYNFKSAVVDRCFNLGRETGERDFYLQWRKW